MDFSTIVSPNINAINKTKYSPLLKRGAGGDLVNRLKNPPEAESLTSRQGAGGKKGRFETATLFSLLPKMSLL